MTARMQTKVFIILKESTLHILIEPLVVLLGLYHFLNLVATPIFADGSIDGAC